MRNKFKTKRVNFPTVLCKVPGLLAQASGKREEMWVIKFEKAYYISLKHIFTVAEYMRASRLKVFCFLSY